MKDLRPLEETLGLTGSLSNGVKHRSCHRQQASPETELRDMAACT